MKKHRPQITVTVRPPLAAGTMAGGASGCGGDRPRDARALGLGRRAPAGGKQARLWHDHARPERRWPKPARGPPAPAAGSAEQVAQFGAPKAITATARKLACLVYAMISTRQEYRVIATSAYQERFDEQRLRSFPRR